MDDPEPDQKISDVFDIEDFMKVRLSEEKLLDMRNKRIFKNIDLEKLDKFIRELSISDVSTDKKYDKAYRQLQIKYKVCPKKAHLFNAYRQLVEKELIKQNISLEHKLVAKKGRALSGVLVITVLTSPGKFSCPKDCNYCPNEPGQPRSYLKDEPAVQRANRNNFDPIKQFFDRATTHFINGHPIDKIEVLVLGGTWSSYPVDYQEEFIRDLYYAANIFLSDKKKRKKGLLEEEQKINETSRSRIIGLTLETRPDFITWQEIGRFRKYGCTRVQLGIQHTEEEILKIINRDCTTNDAIRALQMLKDCAYKIDAHFMPDLPGSTPMKDWQMFSYVLSSPLLQFDQWKIYPCEITPYTKIKEWYEDGSFVPYSENNEKLLVNLIMLVKNSVLPWIRLNRVIRDIPNQYIIAGNKVTNLRQQLQKTMKEKGLACDCIRCREVKDGVIKDPILVCRKYPSNDGIEYFLSFESKDMKTIYGFLRLRLTKDAGRIYSRGSGQNYKKRLYFPELEGCALVRELHVYGQLIAVAAERVGSNDDAIQHYGFGKRLVMCAEKIALEHKYKKMAIISGVGVKEYYRKLGYVSKASYVIKNLTNDIKCVDKDYVHSIDYTTPDGNIKVNDKLMGYANELLDSISHFNNPVYPGKEKEIEKKSTYKYNLWCICIIILITIFFYVLLLY